MEFQRIGRYDIKSLIGQGGMSTVYLGYDPRSQREVAIKILPPYYLHSTKFRERFEREAYMIALLEHPAIVPVYDMGEEDGQPYIVMRYMSGGSLSEKIKKGPIPLRECMEMYLRLAPALDTAHARGVTHRDVKPDNLLFDKYDNVFLSDFGLARLRETIGFANISDGSIMGTPAYMSPEQIQGDRQIDGRSDIYSMGVVLYQMLCGEVPFSGTTAASVMMMHLVNPVPQIRDVNTTLPTGIQGILDIAMAKKADDRYQSAGEFAKAIQAVTTGVHRKPAVQPVTSVGRRTASISQPVAQQSSNAASTPSSAASSTSRKTNARVETAAKPVPLPGSIASKPAKTKPIPSSRRTTLLKRRFILPIWGWIIGVFFIFLLSLAAILWWQGWLPFLSPSGAILKPEQPQLVDTQISQTSSTEMVASTIPGMPGQADKLAFVTSSDIWVSDLDGNNLIQLTTDGEKKTNLNWTPDGQSVIYSTGNCIKLVGLQTREVLTKTCIEGIDPISTFAISPDSQQVALGLDQTDLYILPYSQLFNLHEHSQLADIQSIASCAHFAPYDTGDVLKTASWSASGDRLAMLLSTPVDGVERDEVSMVDFSQCTAEPTRLEEILPTHFLFTLRDYYNHPEISSLSWNADDQLILNGYVNDGFGDLQLYNLDQGDSHELTPNGSCCYRDARWSPDGSYVLYSYQPEAGGEVSLYYVPADEISQSGKYLALNTTPVVSFTSSQGSLQPALRAAHQ